MVALNFMCHPYQATGCSEIRWNIIAGVSVTVFPDEINIWICRQRKQIALPSVGESHPIWWSHEQNKKVDLPWEGKNSFCPVAFKLGHRLFPAFGLKLKYRLLLGLEPTSLWTEASTISCPCSQSLGLRLQLRSLALLGLQFADSPCRSWDLLVSIITWALLAVNLFTHTHLPTRLVLFLWRTLLESPRIFPVLSHAKWPSILSLNMSQRWEHPALHGRSPFKEVVLVSTTLGGNPELNSHILSHEELVSTRCDLTWTQ